MTSVPHLSSGLHAGIFPTGPVSLILRSTHPEDAFSCLHEEQRGVTGESLECHHDDPIFSLFPLSAPEMLGEGSMPLPDLRLSLVFPPEERSFTSVQSSACKPPPRK